MNSQVQKNTKDTKFEYAFGEEFLSETHRPATLVDAADTIIVIGSRKQTCTHHHPRYFFFQPRVSVANFRSDFPVLSLFYIWFNLVVTVPIQIRLQTTIVSYRRPKEIYEPNWTSSGYSMLAFQ